MDTASLFKDLVTGKFVSDFDYCNNQFAFQTVFHTSPTEYCCCSCGYEHEFFEYISENGDVNEEMYSKILESITKGKCPHVDDVPPEFVTETCVYGIHIASVAGPLRAIKRYSYNYLYKRSSLFELNPCQTAILKEREDFVDVFYKAMVIGCSLCNSHSSWKKYILCGGRVGADLNTVQFRYMSVIGYCAQQGNFRMTKTVLNSFTAHNPVDIAKVLELTFTTKLKEIQRAVLKYFGKGNRRALESCAQVSILYDQPDILAEVLKKMTKDPRIDYRFIDAFALLQRDACQLILTNSHLKSSNPKLSTDEEAQSRMKLLVSFIDTFPTGLTDEIVSEFKTTVNRDSIDGSPDYHHLSLLSVYIDTLQKHHNVSDDGVNYEDKVNLLLQLGANIDHEKDGLTPMSRLLDERNFQYLPRFRQLLELLIYENSSLELNTSVVTRGIKREIAFRDTHIRNKRLHVPAIYLMDVRAHPYYGHEDHINYAFNFIGPLLIECGYPVTREDLEEALSVPSTHSTEKEYYKQVLDNPRPLQFQCRDTLRRHFKGRAIHKFVYNSNIPKHIGEIILLTPLLRNINIARCNGV